MQFPEVDVMHQGCFETISGWLANLTGRHIDQQLGQMYELMTTIREQELAENDPEYSASSKERE
jgi:hypothetical protein